VGLDRVGVNMSGMINLIMMVNGILIEWMEEDYMYHLMVL